MAHKLIHVIFLLASFIYSVLYLVSSIPLIML